MLDDLLNQVLDGDQVTVRKDFMVKMLEVIKEADNVAGIEMYVKYVDGSFDKYVDDLPVLKRLIRELKEMG